MARPSPLVPMYLSAQILAHILRNIRFLLRIAIAVSRLRALLKLATTYGLAPTSKCSQAFLLDVFNHRTDRIKGQGKPLQKGKPAIRAGGANGLGYGHTDGVPGYGLDALPYFRGSSRRRSRSQVAAGAEWSNSCPRIPSAAAAAILAGRSSIKSVCAGSSP